MSEPAFIPPLASHDFHEPEAQWLLAKAQELIGFGYWKYHAPTQKVFWPPNTFKLFGLEPQAEAPSYEYYLEHLVHPNDKNHVYSAVLALIENQTPYNIEIRHKQSNGSYRYCRAQGEVWIEAGAPVGIIGVVIDIHAQKMSELQEHSNKLNLQRTHESLLHAVNSAAIVTIADTQGVITFVNEHFCEISGYEDHELLGRKYEVLRSGQHKGEFYRDIWMAISKGEVWRGEMCNKRKDGSLYWVDTTIVPQFGGGGMVENYISIGYDITEKQAGIAQIEASLMKYEKLSQEYLQLNENLKVRRSALAFQLEEIKGLNQALMQREAMMRQAGQMAKLGSWQINLENMELSLSGEAHDLLGLAYQNRMALSYIVALFEEADREILLRAFDALLDRQQAFDMVLRLSAVASGMPKWVRIAGGSDSYESHKKGYGLIQDITQEKKIEDKLRESQAHYKFLTENLAEVVSLYDGELKCIYITPSVEQLWGYSDEEFKTTSWILRTHPEDVEAIRAVLEQHVRSQAKEVFHEWRTKHKNGHYFWIESKGKLYYDINGKLIRLILSFSNITQRKEAEIKLKETLEQLSATIAQLKSAQAQLIHSEKMASLGLLTAGIAHEINNPINFIYGGVFVLNENLTILKEAIDKYEALCNVADFEELREKKNAFKDWKEKEGLDILVPEIDKIVGAITEGARRTAEIVKGLRTFSRTDNAESNLFNIHDGLDSSLLLLNHLTKNRIQVVKEYGYLQPILCYPSQLNQVFMNILSNAIHAIPSNGKIHIRTSLTENNYVCVEIEDSGMGIAPEHLQKVFQPFFTTKSTGEGMGLGLSIVHGIIEKHKGSVHISSKVGKGTCVKILLPYETTINKD